MQGKIKKILTLFLILPTIPFFDRATLHRIIKRGNNKLVIKLIRRKKQWQTIRILQTRMHPTEMHLTRMHPTEMRLTRTRLTRMHLTRTHPIRTAATNTKSTEIDFR